MTKRYLALLLTMFLLAACSGQEQALVTEAPLQEAETQPTETAAATEAEPTETEAAASGKVGTASGVQMECTLVSDQPDAPAEYVAIFGVTEDDWAIGPETAAVTFVEYGDFQ
jgi:hypothetical protein